VRTVFSSLLEDKVNDLKEFIKSYIETYQDNVNMANNDFISEVVKSDITLKMDSVQLGLNNQKENDYDEKEGNLNERDKNYDTIRTSMFKQLLSGLSDEKESQGWSEKVKLHKDLSCCYFEIFRKIVRDFVQQRIKHKMVKAFVKNLDKNLNEKIFQVYLFEEKFKKTLLEDKNYEEYRYDAEAKLDAVKKALNAMIDIQYKSQNEARKSKKKLCIVVGVNI